MPLKVLRKIEVQGYVCVSLCECVSVRLGIATQTEATLISVLESNLACVQNSSLYQLGGSLPCLESAFSHVYW